MHILSILLFVISATLDNVVVGIAYGIRKLKISVSSNILIAFISCAGTLISMTVGKFISTFICERSENLIGSSILILLGIWFTVSSFKTSDKKDTSINSSEKQNMLESYKSQCEEILISPEKADKDNSGCIDLKESLFLGFALALNNMGLGIGASITGLSITLTSIFTFVFNLTAIPIGYILGKRFLSSFLENKANLISGMIIILLGLYQLFIG
ncbi:sporulation membrane protein YtaF [Clostridium thailandense]|uniref:sporulation membrane protein YtaF n=1 Tax=Clostridium thailandense TaxID=2794346 RepID=UPI0039898255